MYSCIESVFPDVRFRFHENGVLRPGERIRLLIDNCALLERRTETRWVYRAVNIYDFQSKHLFTSASPIHSGRYDHTADLILQSSVDYRPIEYAGKTYAERAADLLTAIFCRIYPLYGFTFREAQLTLSLEILSGLFSNKIMLSEAEVGTGKTHAYITALAVFSLFAPGKLPALLSTSTIALQKAITEDYIPQISAILCTHAILERPFTALLRKGKAHYACDRRLYDYCASLNGWADIGFQQHSQLALLCQPSTEDIDLSHYGLSR